MQKSKILIKYFFHNRWLLSQRLLFVLILFGFLQLKSQTEFVTIPKGVYMVGKKNHLLNPLRKIRVDSFQIATTELTNAEFDIFVKSTQYKTDAEKFQNALVFEPGLEEYRWLQDSTANWRFPNGITRGGIEHKMNHPVTCISYRDALAYCQWAGVRLPTLDEWEIASRATMQGYFFWGKNRDSIAKYANIWHGKNHLVADSSDGYMYTSPVKSFAPNQWGLYDIYGNVFELCSNQLIQYKKRKNVVHARGGSWWCSINSCNFFNSVDIGRVSKFASFSNQGFRVVKD